MPPATPDAASPDQITAWDGAEIIAATRECRARLEHLDVAYEQAPPLRTGLCGTPAPVTLKRVAGVDLQPPALMNCRMVQSLHAWVTTHLQAAATSVVGSRIVRLRSAASYHCRPRNGVAGRKLSEHAFANALDIAAFEFESGALITVRDDWPAAAPDAASPLHRRRRKAAPAASDEPQLPTPAGTFLRTAHATACSVFTTVLGPEADAAHHDHMHVDLATRRSGRHFCQ